ncbi:unnamed protein product [Thlaspi arvense]|uniref:TF-B3 domain-containing protein n=1 Tax=Thlaspi arvense TaxID=13288 RepID=A0AAU9R9G1_THLAR|nr:unnamed protein product [Thlaspi arvense]
MADQSLHSPINPHFFKPLLPGFHSHLNIPVAFFSKHVQGRNDHIKTAKLRSDASDKTWTVKMDGLKLTDGWEDFAVAHDLRIGDIIVFRHEGEMLFHVTAFGPSCCEIQYTSSSSSSHNINDDSRDQTNNIGNNSRKKRKRVKKSPRNRVETSSDHSHFLANVTASSLRFDQLYIPRGFASTNGLQEMSGEKIVVLNEEGRAWNANLIYNQAGMHTLVRPGWRRFCAENGMSQGHQYTFKLVRKSEPPVIRLCHAESSLHHSCYEGSVSAYSLKTNKLYLPRNFVTENGLDKGCREIVLTDERGRRWSLALKHYESRNQIYIGPGWETFCQGNGIKAGDSFKLELVGTGEKPVLSLCSSNGDKTPLGSLNTSSGDDSRKSQKSEKESLGEKSISQECLLMEEEEKKKTFSRCRASSSYSQDQFVRITLTRRAVKNYKLMLPVDYTRGNGINKPGKITLLSKDGVRQVVDLLQNKRTGVMRIGKGWREFCDAHGVKIGVPFVLELIREEEASPVLKFCTKVDSV